MKKKRFANITLKFNVIMIKYLLPLNRLCKKSKLIWLNVMEIWGVKSKCNTNFFFLSTYLINLILPNVRKCNFYIYNLVWGYEFKSCHDMIKIFKNEFFFCTYIKLGDDCWMLWIIQLNSLFKYFSTDYSKK